MSEALRKAAEKAILAMSVVPTKIWIEYGLKDVSDALRAALAEPEQSEPVCNPHPKAPHGFNRNGSHSAGRYVCDCESWEPYASGYNDGFHAGMETENGLQTISDIGQLQELPEPVAWMDSSGHPKHIRHIQSATERRLYGELQPLFAAPPRREPDERVQRLAVPHTELEKRNDRCSNNSLR